MFDKAREIYKAEVSGEVQKSKRELELQNIGLAQQKKKITEKNRQLLAFRDKDVIDGDKADADCLRTQQTYEELERRVT